MKTVRTPSVLVVSCLLAALPTPLRAETVPTDPAQCRSEVYIYLDLSGSLSENHKDFLARKLSELAKEDTNHVLISKSKETYLIPFATAIGSAHRVQEKQAGRIKGEIRRFLKLFEAQSNDSFDRSQTNLVNILSDIQRRIGPAATPENSDRSHKVFIIASDFEHDATEGTDDEGTREEDKEHWSDNAQEIINGMRESFKPPRGAILLLISAASPDEYSAIRSKVLDKDLGLRGLTHHDDQVQFIESLPSLSAFDRYTDPFHITSRIEGKEVKIKITNLSCLNLPELQLTKRAGPAILGGPKTFALKSIFAEFEDSILIEKIPRKPAEASTHRPDISIIVKAIDPDSNTLQDFASEPINIDNYFFLEKFKGRLHKYNTGFKINSLFTAVLWERPAKASIELFYNESSIGAYDMQIQASTPEDSLTRQGEFHPRNGTSIFASRIAEVCNSTESRHPKLKVEITTDPPALLIQRDRIKVDVVRDESTDLLESLVKLGSLPAIFTAITFIALTLRRRNFTLATVAEILTVASLFWSALYFLFRRFVPGVKQACDNFLMGAWAAAFAALLAILLVVASSIVLRKGILLLPQSDSEIGLALARRAAEIRGISVPKRRFWPTKRIFPRRLQMVAVGSILIFLPFLLAIAASYQAFRQFRGEGQEECLLLFTDNISRFD